MVPVPDGLPTHAAVELQLLYTLEELHHLLSELRLLPLASIDALAQAVHLQGTELQTPKSEKTMRWDTYAHEIRQVLCLQKITYLVSYSIRQFLSSLQRFEGLNKHTDRVGVRPG